MREFSALQLQLAATGARLSRRHGWGSVPPAKLNPKSLAALQKAYGTPVPLAAIYAANTITRSEASRLRNEAERAELNRRLAAKAEWSREAEQDRWADQWALGGGR